MSKATELFASKAPWIMELLMRDFALDLNSAAAILGNLGHECGGFTNMQEDAPTVKGSKGGYGWAQWTGPRRRAFEAYCERNNLSPNDDRANYGWLFVELSTSEHAGIKAVKKPGSIADKVKAFEMNFERAGVKHYPSRNAWAARALEAYKAAGSITLPAWALPSLAPGNEAIQDVMAEKAKAPPKPPIPRPDDEPDPIAVEAPAETKPAGKGGLIALGLAALAGAAAWLGSNFCNWFGVFCS
jgi:hypothetical protein